MPLLDHFNLPVTRMHPWRSFHGSWAVKMAELLNESVLPAGYVAVPSLDRAGPVEIDIAALHDPTFPTLTGSWQPSEPSYSVTVDLAALEGVGVEVVTDDGDPRLLAAIELVSPSNKDRPDSRQAFVEKAIGYLRQGSSLVVVDIVTTRRADLHTAILAGLGSPATPTIPVGLSAVSYRTLAAPEHRRRVMLWPAGLQLGHPLPTLPLWLENDLLVPLDLDASYRATCEALRIREVG